MIKNIISFPFYVIGVTLFVIAAGLAVIGYLNLRVAQSIGE